MFRAGGRSSHHFRYGRSRPGGGGGGASSGSGGGEGGAGERGASVSDGSGPAPKSPKTSSRSSSSESLSTSSVNGSIRIRRFASSIGSARVRCVSRKDAERTSLRDPSRWVSPPHHLLEPRHLASPPPDIDKRLFFETPRLFRRQISSIQDFVFVNGLYEEHRIKESARRIVRAKLSGALEASLPVVWGTDVCVKVRAVPFRHGRSGNFLLLHEVAPGFIDALVIARKWAVGHVVVVSSAVPAR